MATPGRSNKYPHTTGSEPRWATVEEAAEYLRVGKRTIREMRADGRIRAYNFGSRLIRFDLNEIDAGLRASNGNGAA
jgi:excisionase family DNA binding protein